MHVLVCLYVGMYAYVNVCVGMPVCRYVCLCECMCLVCLYVGMYAYVNVCVWYACM